MSLQFYAYARKGHEFLDEVARELSISDVDRAGRLTRCVFRALRNKLTVPESFKLIAQLPMALKAVYMDGWKHPDDSIGTTTASDFISEVIKEDDRSAWRDFSTEDEVKDAVSAVFRVLASHTVAGEFLNIVKVLPQELRSKLIERVSGKPTTSVEE
ncbi:MAG: DUF2267 domain-containing protein [Bacteroidota bacterium]